MVGLNQKKYFREITDYLPNVMLLFVPPVGGGKIYFDASFISSAIAAQYCGG